MTVVQGVRSRRRYISSFSVSDINRRCLDAWSLERAAFKIYRSIKMIARRAAASETAFRGFISRRCIKHVQQQAGSRKAQLDHDSRGGRGSIYLARDPSLFTPPTGNERIVRSLLSRYSSSWERNFSFVSFFPICLFCYQFNEKRFQGWDAFPE